MKFPWANTLLLALIAVELVSGFFGLVSNSPDEAYFILLHRIAGWGIIAVLAWKIANVVRSLRWPRSATPRTASHCIGSGTGDHPGARIHMVIRGTGLVLAFQRRKLAHIHRRRAHSNTHLARPLPHARFPASFLGGQADVSPLRWLWQ